MIKIRCSQLGRLMTEPRSKLEKLSETAKALCHELFIEQKYGRKKIIESKYLIKGRTVEEESITAYNIYRAMNGDKTLLVKNTERRTNEYITGEPDILNPVLADIKSSWDIFTFTESRLKPINKDYWWQLQGYMWLFGFEEGYLVHVLVNTPDEEIERQTRWRTCQENEFKFDDIPIEERVSVKIIKRDDEAIERIKEKVIYANEYIQTL